MTRFPEDISTASLVDLMKDFHNGVRGDTPEQLARVELAMDELMRRGVCALVVERLMAMRVPQVPQ